MTQSDLDRRILDDPRYHELRRLARRLIGDRPSSIDPDPTELVHECYLRLARQERWDELDDKQRRAYAARALRNTLIDLRRAEASIKRGGLRSRLTLDDQMAEAGRDDALDILALSEAVEALAAVHADQADVLVLRYFGGLTVAETSELVGRPLRTVSNDWAFACAWLKRHLSR